MRINPEYLPDSTQLGYAESCYCVVKVATRNWQVIDSADGFLVCTCKSKFLARHVAHALNFHEAIASEEG